MSDQNDDDPLFWHRTTLYAVCAASLGVSVLIFFAMIIRSACN